MPKGIKGSSPTYNCKNCGKENKIKHSTTNTYCDNNCQIEYQNKNRVTQWLEEGKDWGLQIPNWAKKWIANRDGYKCSICNISSWNNNYLTLECDHIDGNPKNNKPNNLRLLCPNCHSQTESYKGKNYGKGRDTRYLK